MQLSAFLHVKDRLMLAMVICIASSIILAVFSIDYLRKMESEAVLLYEQRLLVLQTVHEAKEELAQTEQLSPSTYASLQARAFDSKASYYEQQLKTAPTVALLQQYEQYILQSAQERVTAYKAAIKRGYYLIAATSGFLVLLVLYVSLSANRAIRRPTTELMTLMARAKQGDFTAYSTNTSRDELGQLTTSYNQMVDELKQLFAVVHTSAAGVAAANTYVSACSETLTELAQSITDETAQMAVASHTSAQDVANYAAKIQEMTAQMTTFTAHMLSMRQAIEQTMSSAIEGKQLIEANVYEINVVNDTVQHAYGTMQTLHDHAQQITGAVDLMKGIAANTKLLALNAEIEAAHASVYGKGFTVVAQQVKQLAAQSMEATQTIEHIVAQMLRSTSHTLQAITDAHHRVVHSTQTANVTAKQFDYITSNMTALEPILQHVHTLLAQMGDSTQHASTVSYELAVAFDDNAVNIQHIEQAIIEQHAKTVHMHEQIAAIDAETTRLQHALARFRM